MVTSRRTLAIVLTVALAALAATPLVAQTPPALKTTELGKGPTLVLLPGLGGTRMQWLPTARKLIGSYHVVMADLPGHGESGMPDPFDYDAGAAMISALLAKQNPESTVVVAQGVGGAMALVAARAHPEQLRGLVLIDAQLVFRLPNGESVPDQQKQYFLQYIDANYDQVVKQMFMNIGRDTTQGKELAAKAALVPPNNMKAYLRTSLNTDATGALKGNKTPLLYIGSSRAWPDTVQWAAIARQRGFNDAVSMPARRVENSGAMIASDQPDTLAAVIADFARSVLAKK